MGHWGTGQSHHLPTVVTNQLHRSFALQRRGEQLRRVPRRKEMKRRGEQLRIKLRRVPREMK